MYKKDIVGPFILCVILTGTFLSGCTGDSGALDITIENRCNTELKVDIYIDDNKVLSRYVKANSDKYFQDVTDLRDKSSFEHTIKVSTVIHDSEGELQSDWGYIELVLHADGSATLKHP